MKTHELYHAILFVQRVCPVLNDTHKTSETAEAVVKINAVRKYFSDRVLNFPFHQDAKLEDVPGVNDVFGIVHYVLEQYSQKNNQTANKYKHKIADIILSGEGIYVPTKPDVTLTNTINQFIGYAPESELFHALYFVRNHGNLNAELLRPLQQYQSDRILGTPRTDKWPVLPSLEKVPERDKVVTAVYHALNALAEQEASGKCFGDDGIAARYRDNVAFLIRHHHLDVTTEPASILASKEATSSHSSKDATNKLLDILLAKQQTVNTTGRQTYASSI